MEVSNRLIEFDRRLRDLLDAGRFAEARAVLDGETGPLVKDGALAEESVERLRFTVDEEVRKTARRLEAEAEFLDGLERDDELEGLCRKALEVLEGDLGSPFRRKLEFVAARSAARATRAREAEERKAREAEDAAAAARMEAQLVEAGPVGLAAALAGPVRAGALAARTYRFGDSDGSPAGMDEKLQLLVKGAGGERKIPFADIPPAIQVAMALDGLAGDPLLEAAAFAHASGLGKEGDRLLLKYLEEEKGSAARKARVDEALARLRGLPSVPEGGFTWSKENGWEDARTRADRQAIVDALRLGRTMLAADDAGALEKPLTRVLAYLDDARLGTSGRSEIRKSLVENLEAVRKKAIATIASRAGKKTFGDIRQAHEELKRRRAAALKLIYDPAIYLPESHPDYPKGDVVNGQKAVDDAVKAVRELWEKSSAFAVSIDPRIGKTAALLERVEKTLAEKLFHEPDRKAAEGLEEVLANLDRKIDLRRYAADRAEAALHEYNRKVDEYNRQLADPDVSETDKAHVECLNDYREMLGHRRLFIDARLCRATRKHSAACSAAGSIWHVGPDGSPGSRAAAEGFPGGVAENVAIGYANPKDIWIRGWYRASDHHRNALAAGHNCMGYGYSGTVGTQNFSSIVVPFR